MLEPLSDNALITVEGLDELLPAFPECFTDTYYKKGNTVVSVDYDVAMENHMRPVEVVIIK